METLGYKRLCTGGGILWKKSIDLNQLPIGSKIVDPNTKYYGKPIVWIIADKNHKGYPDNTITLISEKILCLKCFDAIEPNNSNDNRKRWGNSNYKYSNLLSWLNSSGYRWYRSQHNADAPPSSPNIYGGNPYDTEQGFLTGFSKKFRQALVPTSFNIKVSYADRGTGSNFVTSNIFLASKAEVSFYEAYTSDTVISLFNNSEYRKAYPTYEAYINSSFKPSNMNTSSAYRWWLRNTDEDDIRAAVVGEDGNQTGQVVNEGDGGVRPLCNIRNDSNFFEIEK